MRVVIRDGVREQLLQIWNATYEPLILMECRAH
jgi:hypothetical protein